jgi:hypothetical protein
MTVNKTRATEASVAAFVDALEPARRLDAKAVIRMMKSATGEKPKMWGPSIIGRRGVTGQVGETHHRQRLPLHQEPLRCGPENTGGIDR